MARSKPVGSQKTAAQAVAMVRIGTARSETDPGSVIVALGRAQFGAQSFFQLFKNCSNFVIQICCLPEFPKCPKFASC
jgi:hypothetical protein